MRRIFSYSYILMLLLCSAVFSAIFAYSFWCSGDSFLASFVGRPAFCAAVMCIVGIFIFPNCISYNDSEVRVSDCPLLAGNRFYLKKNNLRKRNGRVVISEVEAVEVVRLSKREKLLFVGYNHWFEKYLKIQIKNSASPKYIYVSRYTDAQINRIKSVLEAKLGDRGIGNGSDDGSLS